MDKNGTLTSLNYFTLQEVPEPFFTEYARFYSVNVLDDSGQRRDLLEIATNILAAGGSRKNPPTIPILSCHAAKYINGVLHFRRQTYADYRAAADPKKRGDFPVENLLGPEDEYSDEEQEREQPASRQKTPPPPCTPAMMDPAFPPLGGKAVAPTEEETAQEKVQQPVSGADLGARLADLEDESKAAQKELAEAETALKKAVYDHETLLAEIEEERVAWKALWGYVEQVAGKKVVQECLARAMVRARGEILADEVKRALAEGEVLDPKDAMGKWIAKPAPLPESAPPAPPALQSSSTPAPQAEETPVLPDLPLSASAKGGNPTSERQDIFLKRRREPEEDPSQVDRSNAALDSAFDGGVAGTPRTACSSGSRKRSRVSAKTPATGGSPGTRPRTRSSRAQGMRGRSGEAATPVGNRPLPNKIETVIYVPEDLTRYEMVWE